MPAPFALSEFHSVFPGSVRWRLTPSGIEIEAVGHITVGSSARTRTRAYLSKFGEMYASASTEYSVPLELLVACSLTEGAVADPEKSVRKEPGYISDAQTPNRISVGLCQLLISTARSVMKDPAINRAWLSVPLNNLRACAAYMKQQAPRTYFDPVLVACAYNAGGVYENKGEKNRWRLRQYPLGTSHHADRFTEFFNAAVETSEPFAGGASMRYKSLLA